MTQTRTRLTATRTLPRATMTRRAALAGLCCLAALPAHAAQRRYTLEPDGSRVGFQFQLSGRPQTGTIPIQSADIMVDTGRLTRSKVSVVLNAQGAQTALPFALGPLKSEQVLGVNRWPQISFVSQKIKLGPDGRISNGATMTAALTLRGVTKPVTLDAALYRTPGSAADDLDRLRVHLKGAVSRSAFGATGYPELVGDEVALDVTARIRAA